MKEKFLLFFLILLFFKTEILFPQDGSKNVSKVGTTAGTFLEIGVGPSNGMGGAFVSLANDATALYWNSAGIANFVQNEVSIVHINWLASTNLDYAALVIPLRDIGNIGFSFTSLSMGDEKVRTVEMPEGTGEYYSASDIAVAVSYARNLTERFSIGFSAKYVQESIWHMSSNAFAIDVGTLFRTDLIGGLTIGASISNFGTKMQLSGRDTRTFESVDPTKQGSNDRVPYVIDLDSWDLPLVFRIGLSTNVVKTDDYRFTVAIDAQHPNDNYESVNTGAEFSFKDFLFIRGGYQSLFLVDKEGGLTFGAGINSKMLFSNDLFRFDYSYRDFGRLNAVHSFSIGIKF
jgi:Uncharacterised protein family (UPF0164)